MMRTLILEIPEFDVQRKAKSIRDAVEVLRALSDEMADFEELLKDYLKDSDGSAKIALIAIDRSLAAWLKLYKNFLDSDISSKNISKIIAEYERIA